ncbi:MAG: hypothetical protein H7Y16_10725 [Candidatus Parcubacteria bacterium]|nr:hypothetical protein [Burkholderiales bacterium]
MTNAVLLYGLFVLVWSPGTIAFLFWFEAVAIGVAAFARVAASLPGDVPGSGRSVTYQRLPRPGGSSRVSSSVPRVNALLALPLFVLLYGLLLLAYGGLLLAALKEPNYPAVAGTAISSEGVRFAMVLIAGEQLWAFWRGYLRGPAWQRKDPTFHFWQPFGLAIVTWLAFFFGFLMLGWLNSPLVVLAVLIVLKAVAGLCGALIDAQAAQWQRV